MCIKDYHPYTELCPMGLNPNLCMLTLSLSFICCILYTQEGVKAPFKTDFMWVATGLASVTAETCSSFTCHYTAVILYQRPEGCMIYYSHKAKYHKTSNEYCRLFFTSNNISQC